MFPPKTPKRGAELRRSPRHSSPAKESDTDMGVISPPMPIPPSTMRPPRSPPKAVNVTPRLPNWKQSPLASPAKNSSLPSMRSPACECQCCPHTPGIRQSRGGGISSPSRPSVPHSDRSIEHQQVHPFADAVITGRPCTCECCPHPSEDWEAGGSLRYHGNIFGRPPQPFNPFASPRPAVKGPYADPFGLRLSGYEMGRVENSPILSPLSRLPGVGPVGSASRPTENTGNVFRSPNLVSLPPIHSPREPFRGLRGSRVNPHEFEPHTPIMKIDDENISSALFPALPSSSTLSQSPAKTEASRFGTFGGPLTAPQPRRLHMVSFIDPLDEQITEFDPSKLAQEGTPSPPPVILNAPYEMSGIASANDKLDPNYDSDWNDRLFDPVPGAGVYLRELKDPTRTPRDRNVVYISLDVEGNPITRALPFDRRGRPISFQRRSEVERKDICFRKGLGKKWIEGGAKKKSMDHMKELAKKRILLKIKLDRSRSLRFQQDLTKFWREKNHPPF